MCQYITRGMPVLAFIRKVDVTLCSGLVSNVRIDIIIVLWAAYGRLQTAVCRKKPLDWRIVWYGRKRI